MQTQDLANDRASLLVLSLCDTPVSIDSLVAWNFARPVDLWRVLDHGLKSSLIAEHSESGPGYFFWADEKHRDRLWQEASLDDWSAALGHTDIIQRAMDQAHKAVAAQDRNRALAMFRALVNARRPEIFPGGEKGFMQTVLESCLFFVRAEWRSLEIVERAIEIAEQNNDTRAVVLLFGVEASMLVLIGSIEKAEELSTRSCDLAVALDDPDILKHASLGLALTRILAGEFRAGVDAVERLLGNVPQEILPEIESRFPEESTLAVEIVGTIALAYSVVGQPTRAIDLLHRMAAISAPKGRKDIDQLVRLYLGLMSADFGDVEPARQYGQSVLDYWLTEGDRPFFAWFASIMMAILYREDNRPEAAREVLTIGHQARLRAHFPYFFGSGLLYVLEWLKKCDVAPIDGLTFESEIDRYLSWYNIRMRGLAHLMKARDLAASGRREDIEKHLSEAEPLLRRSGALRDIALLLEERALWDEKDGHTARASERRSDAEAIRRSVPALVPGGTHQETAAQARAVRVVELGRLLLCGRQPDNWGEIAARLCSHLGAERCAIVEAGDPPRLLAVRGGSRVWSDALVADINGCCDSAIGFVKPPWNEEDRNERGQLLVIPFASSGFNKKGWVAIENRRVQPTVGPEDHGLIEALAAQISVLFENASLWQELQAARSRLEQENRYYREMDRADTVASSFVGRSGALRQTLDLVSRVAPTDSAVLITGETGVGKELVAREIHRLSPRNTGPFIPVHIASLSSGLVASSLFGHERGAFTGATEQVRGRFELADGGTLFLDEIGELGPDEQVRLLRVLQEGTFERVGGTKPIRSDFRLVAATNRDLAVLVKAGRFREDLFYRLNVFPLAVPPLRERVEDIPMLALFFMEQCARRLGRTFEGITESDMARLQAYPWPGNVRELMHFIERAAVLSDGPRLKVPTLAEADIAVAAPVTPDDGAQEWVSLAEAERRYIRRVLAHVKGRLTGQGGAAQILGLKPSTLHFKLGKLGLKNDLARSRR